MHTHTHTHTHTHILVRYDDVDGVEMRQGLSCLLKSLNNCREIEFKGQTDIPFIPQSCQLE